MALHSQREVCYTKQSLLTFYLIVYLEPANNRILIITIYICFNLVLMKLTSVNSRPKCIIISLIYLICLSDKHKTRERCKTNCFMRNFRNRLKLVGSPFIKDRSNFIKLHNVERKPKCCCIHRYIYDYYINV